MAAAYNSKLWNLSHSIDNYFLNQLLNANHAYRKADQKWESGWELRQSRASGGNITTDSFLIKSSLLAKLLTSLQFKYSI